METKFQTSFIPKKPLIPETGARVQRESVSFLMVIGVVLFILSIAAAGGTFAWEKILERQRVSYQETLDYNREQFGTDIRFLERFNAKINFSKVLLDQHVAAADIFDILESSTVDNVRYTSFEAVFPDAGKKERILLLVKGEGANFSALAFQSDVYGANPLLKDPVVSGLAISETGAVNFALTAGIEPKDISFRKYIASFGAAPAAQAAVGSTSTPVTAATSTAAGTTTPNQ